MVLERLHPAVRRIDRRGDRAFPKVVTARPARAVAAVSSYWAWLLLFFATPVRRGGHAAGRIAAAGSDLCHDGAGARVVLRAYGSAGRCAGDRRKFASKTLSSHAAQRFI